MPLEVLVLQRPIVVFMNATIGPYKKKIANKENLKKSYSGVS